MTKADNKANETDVRKLNQNVSAKNDGPSGVKENSSAAGKPSIEENFANLEKILDSMESDETGLEETFRLYEKGMSIIKDVRQGIDRVEKEIKILEEETGNEL